MPHAKFDSCGFRALILHTCTFGSGSENKNYEQVKGSGLIGLAVLETAKGRWTRRQRSVCASIFLLCLVVKASFCLNHTFVFPCVCAC